MLHSRSGIGVTNASGVCCRDFKEESPYPKKSFNSFQSANMSIDGNESFRMEMEDLQSTVRLLNMSFADGT